MTSRKSLIEAIRLLADETSLWPDPVRSAYVRSRLLSLARTGKSWPHEPDDAPRVRRTSLREALDQASSEYRDAPEWERRIGETNDRLSTRCAGCMLMSSIHSCQGEG